MTPSLEISLLIVWLINILMIYKEHRENKDSKGQLALKENKVQEAYKDYRGFKESVAQSDRKEIEDHRGFKGSEVRLALKESKAIKERLDLKGHRVKQEKMLIRKQSLSL